MLYTLVGEHMHYIYSIQNKNSLKIYIGQSIHPNKRWKQHIGSAKRVLIGKIGSSTIYISRAMAKHGIENFEYQVLEEWETQEEVDDAECFWIDFLSSRNPALGYNLVAGGKYGVGSGPDHPNYGKPSHNRLWSYEEEKALCERYTNEQLSITKLAVELDCDQSTIHKMLQRHGVEILGNKVLSKGKHYSVATEFKKGQKAHNKLFSEEQEKEICRQYIEDKINTVKLGKIYGCHKSVISRMMVRHGFPLRKGKLTTEQKKAALEDYAISKSSRKTAAKYGVSKFSILRLVKKANHSLCV